MKKQMKAVFGLILAAAALLGAVEARAEISIGVGLEGYMPAANMRAVELRAAQLEKLSDTAVSLSEAGGRDTGKTEVLLAGLYAGSVNAEAAPAVYREANRAPAVNKTARICLPYFDRPADEAPAASTAEEVKKDEGAAEVKDGKEEAAEEKPAEEAGAADEAKPGSDKATGFWGAVFLVLLLLLFLL